MWFGLFCEVAALGATGWFLIESGAGRWYKWTVFGILALSLLLPMLGMWAADPSRNVLLLSHVAFVLKLGLGCGISVYWLEAHAA